jgi:predicted DNA-binding transcriptional regulator YafY
MLDTPAQDVADAELDAHFAAASGSFGGPASHTAVLRFSPQSARWVQGEHWHPRQEQRWLADGRLELRIPYGADTELIMDILRHGPDVEVANPPELREAVKERLHRAAALYSG